MSRKTSETTDEAYDDVQTTKKTKTSTTPKRSGMTQLKYEVADELGIEIQQGDNGHLTTYEAGQIGGNMVKKMIANQTGRS